MGSPFVSRTIPPYTNPIQSAITKAYGIVESERVFGALLEVDRGDFVPDEVSQRAKEPTGPASKHSMGG